MGVRLVPVPRGAPDVQGDQIGAAAPGRGLVRAAAHLHGQAGKGQSGPRQIGLIIIVD